jgi:hypothetical protein
VRGRLGRRQGPQDLEDDVTAGFQLIHGWAVDDPAIGIAGVIRQIRERFGPEEEQRPVYVSCVPPSVPAPHSYRESHGLIVLRLLCSQGRH